MVESSLKTELSIQEFLKKYSGTHKLSELHQRFGSETRSALSNLEDKKKIRYHIDQDTRFSGWVIEEDQVPEGYIPSLQKGTLPNKIAKFLEDGPKTQIQILNQFTNIHSVSTIKGRLSEMSHAGQLFRSGKVYKLTPQDDDL